MEIETSNFIIKLLIEDLKKRIHKLEQENSKLVEALEYLENLLHANYHNEEEQIICVTFAYEKIVQTLKQHKKGGNSEKL